mmetsp:Transcript_3660/g.11757  ORF Transcript_3660/g.11757 Transcript_3660/m.11757 type:complete len:297 (-) Transcript_3660:51-941(-)
MRVATARVLARSAATWAGAGLLLDQACRRFEACLEGQRAAACVRGGAAGEARAALGEGPRQDPSWPEGAALGQLAALLAAEEAWRRSGCPGGEAGLGEALRARLGRTLHCAASRVEGAGVGVFARGAAPRGSVLTVYAGTCLGAWDAFLLGALSRAAWWMSHDDSYVLRQADGSSVDGSTHTAQIQRQAHGYVRPSASGQLVNHPPGGARPNAAFLSVYVPPGPAFQRLPLEPWWGHLAGPPRVATLLISLRRIEDGEEVLVDYRLTAGPERLPSWYVPCAGAGNDAAEQYGSHEP